MKKEGLPGFFSPLHGEEVLEVLKPERLAFLWLFVLAAIPVCLGGILLTFYLSVGLFLMVLGVLALVASFFYSGAFTYHLTNKRILLYRKFITISSRLIQYDDLSDVIVDQGIVGRLLGFGNVIPITRSGLGTGMRGWHTGGGWGGRTTGPIVVGGPVSGKVVPSASPSTCLYGIRNPFRVKDLIFKHQEEYAEAPYLKKIAKAVEKEPGTLKGVRYCPFCGSRVEVEEAVFCPSCGKKIKSS